MIDKNGKFVAEVMLDLETLSTKNNACILSIGAVMFDPRGGDITASMEVHVDPKSCTEAGLHLDANTVMWWMADQRDDARKVLMAKERVPLRQALILFNEFMGGVDRPVWGNGATFDNVILRNAYEAMGLPCPWKFWNDRCYRTMKAQYPDVPLARVGTYHSAVDDALTQAVHLQAIFNSISGDK